MQMIYVITYLTYSINSINALYIIKGMNKIALFDLMECFLIVI